MIWAGTAIFTRPVNDDTLSSLTYPFFIRAADVKQNLPSTFPFFHFSTLYSIWGHGMFTKSDFFRFHLQTLASSYS